MLSTRPKYMLNPATLVPSGSRDLFQGLPVTGLADCPPALPRRNEFLNAL